MPCPDSWNASQFGCLRIIPEIAPHYRCPALCGSDAAPACISTAEENAFVLDMAVAFIQAVYGDRAVHGGARIALGSYSIDQHSTSAADFDKCASGDISEFANWLPGHPRKLSAYGSQGGRCVSLLASTYASLMTLDSPIYNASAVGAWVNSACTRPYQTSNSYCLCRHSSAPTPEYHDFLADQVTRIWAIFFRVFLIIVPIGTAIPILIWRAYSLSRHRCTAPLPEDSTPAQAKLAAAEAAASSLRNRVSGTIALVGWALLLLGTAVFTTRYGSEDPTEVLPWAGYFGLTFWGLALLLLSIRPIDVARILNSLRMLLLLGNVFLCWSSGASLDNIRLYPSLLMFGAMVALTRVILRPRYCYSTCLVYAALLAGNTTPDLGVWELFFYPAMAVGFLPVLFSFKPSARSRMPPRVQLRILWIMMRSLLLGFSAVFLLMPFESMYVFSAQSVVNDGSVMAFLVCACYCLLGCGFFSRRNRGRVHRWLGALGKSDSQQQEAASIAALIGSSGRSAVGALALAEQHFRALPISRLTEAELMDNKPSVGLFDKTTHAKSGDVSAFVSHSWSDSGTSKYGHLQDWARTHSNDTIWLDKV